METVKIGVVGCGNVSEMYFENIPTLFNEIEIIGICDLFAEKAEIAAKKYGIQKVFSSVDELVASPEVDIVLNLTIPGEHYAVSLKAIRAGKHVYSEKPLAATLEEGRKLIAAAQENSVRIGCAPDTFLGAGIQTCRKLIDDGFIGTPVGASAFMVCRGHESWHPAPEFYYAAGGGPMMDMGPYYLTALVNLLGGVSSVSGMSKISFPERIITSEPKKGEVIHVEAPTYITGMMRFQNGAAGTIFTTFDVHKAQLPYIEIYGSEGTLSVPDPNTFSGSVTLYRPENNQFTDMPLLFDCAENSRGIGLADMARAIQTNRAHKANGDMALHVLEIMESFIVSSESGAHMEIQSRV